jgi:hypothetical protein
MDPLGIVIIKITRRPRGNNNFFPTYEDITFIGKKNYVNS